MERASHPGAQGAVLVSRRGVFDLCRLRHGDDGGGVLPEEDPESEGAASSVDGGVGAEVVGDGGG